MAVALAPQIEKLTSTNYSSWKNDIQYVLLDKGGLDITLGLEKKPDKKNGATDEQVNEFMRRSNTAMSIIYLNVSPEWRSTICHVRDPHIAWNLLATKMRPDSRAHYMALYSAMNNCFLEEGETINSFASRLTGIAEQLESIGKPFPDDYMCFQILRFLPNRFEIIVQQILMWSEDRFLFKNVSLELAAEEARLAVRESDRLQHRGPAIEVQTVKYKRRTQVVCWKCGLKGHVQKDCRVKVTYNKSGYRTNIPGQLSNVNVKPNVSFNAKPKGNSIKQQPKTKISSQKSFACLVETSLSSCGRDDAWVFDTGASHHFCKDKSLFSSLNEAVEEMHVAVGGVTFPIVGKGVIVLSFDNKLCILNDVFYSPDLRKNLLSGPRFDQAGAKFIGQHGGIDVQDGNHNKLFSAKLLQGIYYTFPKVLRDYNFKDEGVNMNNVNGGPDNSECFTSSASNLNSFEKWHLRMAHISPDLIIKTSKNRAVKGMPNLKHPTDHFCEPCMTNKRNRISFKSLPNTSSKKPLDRIFMDIWGPILVPGRNGERYFLSIIDDFSRKVATYPLRDKSQVFDVFLRHINRAQLFLNTKLKAIRTDQGGEFVNTKFKEFCNETGVKHELTNTYSPEENGVCERFNQTIMNSVRAMLNTSSLPHSFWPEACLHFTYTWNRVCHGKNDITPFELYSGNKPSVRHLRPFGTLAFVGVPKIKRKHKLDAKAKKGALVGYALRTRGYRIWVPEYNKVIETINVSLIEGKFFDGSGAVMGEFPSDPVLVMEDEPRPVDRYASPDPESGASSFPTEEDGSETHPPAPSSSTPMDDPTTSNQKIVWFRKVVPRPDGGKVDIYYYPDGKGKRCPLRSPREVQQYCEKNNIEYKPEDFSFTKHNSYEGIVGDPENDPTITASFSNK